MVAWCFCSAFHSDSSWAIDPLVRQDLFCPHLQESEPWTLGPWCLVRSYRGRGNRARAHSRLDGFMFLSGRHPWELCWAMFTSGRLCGWEEFCNFSWWVSLPWLQRRLVSSVSGQSDYDPQCVTGGVVTLGNHATPQKHTKPVKPLRCFEHTGTFGDLFGA